MPVTRGMPGQTPSFSICGFFFQRLPGLEGLAWNDGTSFADEVTTPGSLKSE